MSEHSGLYHLMEQDLSVKEYYNALPDHIRNQVSRQANQIHDKGSLKKYVQQILNQDN